MTIEELRAICAEHGAYVLESGESIQIVHPQFGHFLWRDDRLYTTAGQPVDEVLDRTFAAFAQAIQPFIDVLLNTVHEMYITLESMKPGILRAGREMRLIYSYHEDRWIPLPDYRIERKRRRNALRKKRNRG